MANGQPAQPVQPGQQQNPQVTQFLTALGSAIQNLQQKNPGMSQQTAQTMAMHPGSTMQGGNIVLAPGQKGPGEQPAPQSDPGSVGWVDQLFSGHLPFGLTFGTPAKPAQGMSPYGPVSRAFGLGKGADDGSGGGGGGAGAGGADPMQDPAVIRYRQAVSDQEKYQAQQQSREPSATDNALTMGFGMFVNQYLAPLMAQMNASNQSAIQQYGNAMNTAMGPGGSLLPPEARATMLAQVPQTQQTLSMLNQAGSQQAAGAGQYQGIIQGLGAETAAAQAVQSALAHAPSVSAYAQGTGQQYIQALIDAGIPLNSPYGAALIGLSQTGSTLPTGAGPTPAQIQQNALTLGLTP